jgi:hypothetical protein
MKGVYMQGMIYHVNDNIGRDAKEKAKKGLRVFPVASSETKVFKEGEFYQFNINKKFEAINIRKFEEGYNYYEYKE